MRGIGQLHCLPDRSACHWIRANSIIRAVKWLIFNRVNCSDYIYKLRVNHVLRHIELYRYGLTDEDAVQNAESVGFRERVLHGVQMPRREEGTFGVSGQLKSIVKYRILGFDKRVSCAKNGCTDLSDLYIMWHVFVQGVAFWGSRWLCLHYNFCGINLLTAINLTHVNLIALVMILIIIIFVVIIIVHCWFSKRKGVKSVKKICRNYL